MQPSEDLERGSRRQTAKLRKPDTTLQGSDTDASGPSAPDDWTSHLKGSDNINVLEFRSGSQQWEDIPITDIEDPWLLSESVLIRLYLVEGLTQKTITYFSGNNERGISEDFFRCHYLNVLPYDRMGFNSDVFFGKWSRPVYQNRQQWQIENRIAKGRPYNLDLVTDPRDVRLDHERYERAMCIDRPYGSLEGNPSLDKNYRRQAIQECISACYKRVNNSLIGVLLFDAPRKVRIIPETYRRTKEDSPVNKVRFEDCFSSFTPSRQRFRQQLEIPANFAALTQNPKSSIGDIILRFVLDDHMNVMSDFREALDFIDEHMSNDHVLRSSLQDWRNLFGQWKRILSNDVSSLAHVTQALLNLSSLNTEDKNAVDPTIKPIGRTNSILRPPLQTDFDKLTQEVQSLTKRAGSTFKSMVSTMAIVESQKAITQAEEITKLTNLAFFFIPLTFCSSIFGMNIVEWEKELRTWFWIIVSLVMLLLTYTALYSKEMTIALSRSPRYLQVLDVNSAARNINRSSLFFMYYCKQLRSGIIAALRFFFSKHGLSTCGVLVLITGWAVGIWAIATKIVLPYGSRVSIGVGFAVGVPAMIILWAGIWEEEYPIREVLKPGLIILALLLVVIGVSIWAIFRYAPLSYGEKVNIAVGMGVGVPLLFTLWVCVVQTEFDLFWPFIVSAILLGALAPSLWAIITKTQLDQNVKVSLSVGLAVGLPCVVPIVFI